MKDQNPTPAPPYEGRKAGSTEPAAPYRQTDESDLEKFKNRLLREALPRATSTEAVVVLRRAANEAAALAWLEPFPMLVFPELFSEKMVAAWRGLERQHNIRTRSARILLEAA
jgi:hypothetical protein